MSLNHCLPVEYGSETWRDSNETEFHGRMGILATSSIILIVLFVKLYKKKEIHPLSLSDLVALNLNSSCVTK